MRIIRIRALRERIAPGLLSTRLPRSASHRYVRSSEAVGEAPRAAQPVWRASKSDGVCDCNRCSQSMRAMPNRLHSNDAKMRIALKRTSVLVGRASMWSRNGCV